MYHFPCFQKKPLTHAVTSIAQGNIDGRFSKTATVATNINNICSQLGFDENSIVQGEQIHATGVAVVDKSDAGKMIKKADGLITTDVSITLLLRVADCAPVIIYDPVNHALGLVHSGWRGTIGKIAPVAIGQMVTNFGCNPNDLMVGIGPCLNMIRVNHPPIQQNLPEWQPFLDTSNKQFTIKLLDFLIHTLVVAGVQQNNICQTGIDTTVSTKYFSHFRSQTQGQPAGRFGVVAKLNKIK